MFKKLSALCVLPLALSSAGHAQITPNNSYSQMLVNSNALLQGSIGIRRNTVTRNAVTGYLFPPMLP